MKTVVGVVLALSLGLAACATDPAAHEEKELALVCSNELPTGSKLPVRRCVTKEQAAQEEKDGRGIRDSASRQAPSREAPGGVRRN
jgi:hypothetical protein